MLILCRSFFAKQSRKAFSAFMLLLFANGMDAQLTRKDWLRADDQTVRLKPSAFPNMPAPVRVELESRGCTIPQPAGADHPQNAVSGSFISAGHTDWAVLCSRNKRSAILIFQTGKADDVDELGDASDMNYLQVVSGDNKIGYSRLIRSLSPISLRNRVTKGAGVTVEHDGIEDVFIEKGSTISYWSGAKWIKLPGGD
jgi:hypothetical protein